MLNATQTLSGSQNYESFKKEKQHKIFTAETC